MVWYGWLCFAFGRTA
jgi:hypothetical protein